MFSLLLIGHILLAIICLSLAGSVVYATGTHKLEGMQNRIKLMWSGAIATLFSGAILTFLSGAPIGRACITFTAFVALVIASHAYYRLARSKISNT